MSTVNVSVGSFHHQTDTDNPGDDGKYAKAVIAKTRIVLLDHNMLVHIIYTVDREDPHRIINKDPDNRIGPAPVSIGSVAVATEAGRGQGLKASPIIVCHVKR